MSPDELEKEVNELKAEQPEQTQYRSANDWAETFRKTMDSKPPEEFRNGWRQCVGGCDLNVGGCIWHSDPC